MTARQSALLVALCALLILVVALMSPAPSAMGQGEDLPATMAVERATATAEHMFWQQDYRMLMHCMTQAARAEGHLTATARPQGYAVSLPFTGSGVAP